MKRSIAFRIESYRAKITPAAFAALIQRLANSTAIPSDLFREYDSRTIARAVVELVRAREPINIPDALHDFNLMRDTRLQLFFNFEDLHRIEERGFLNVHQTERSPTAYTKSRAEVESTLIGLAIEDKYVAGIDNPANYLRPKSTNLSLGNLRNWGSVPKHQLEELRAYGNVIAILKNEVKARATWTPHDSHGQGGKARSFWSKLRNSEKLRSDFGKFKHPDDISEERTYYEAQVWGPLDLSDVDYFMVPESTSLEVIKQLARYGKPVWFSVARSVDGRYQYDAARPAFSR